MIMIYRRVGPFYQLLPEKATAIFSKFPLEKIGDPAISYEE
jgi:hypothetical protein